MITPITPIIILVVFDGFVIIGFVVFDDEFIIILYYTNTKLFCLF